jgi:hypothetical protein
MEGKGCNFQGVSVGGRKRGEAEEVVVKVEERNEGGEGEMSAIVGTSDAQLEDNWSTKRITWRGSGAFVVFPFSSKDKTILHYTPKDKTDIAFIPLMIQIKI